MSVDVYVRSSLDADAGLAEPRRLDACRPVCGPWAMERSSSWANNRLLRARVDEHSRPCVTSISVPRCAEAVGLAVTFGSMNVRSLSPSELDNLLVEFRDRHLDVLLLCETWHDADSVSIRRLRTDGFTVVERVHRRSNAAEMSLCMSRRSRCCHRHSSLSCQPRRTTDDV